MKFRMDAREEEKRRDTFAEKWKMIRCRKICRREIERQIGFLILQRNQAAEVVTRLRTQTISRLSRRRPIMSALTTNTTCLPGRVDWDTQCLEPSSPRSSASQKANRIDRRGGWGSRANAAASSNTPATPLALSSAPLYTAGRLAFGTRSRRAQMVVVRADHHQFLSSLGIAPSRQTEHVAVFAAALARRRLPGKEALHHTDQIAEAAAKRLEILLLRTSSFDPHLGQPRAQCSRRPRFRRAPGATPLPLVGGQKGHVFHQSVTGDRLQASLNGSRLAFTTRGFRRQSGFRRRLRLLGSGHSGVCTQPLLGRGQTQSQPTSSSRRTKRPPFSKSTVRQRNMMSIPGVKEDPASDVIGATRQ